MNKKCICGAPKLAHKVLCRTGWAAVSSDDKAKLLGTGSADLRRRIANRLEQAHLADELAASQMTLREIDETQASREPKVESREPAAPVLPSTLDSRPSTHLRPRA